MDLYEKNENKLYILKVLKKYSDEEQMLYINNEFGELYIEQQLKYLTLIKKNAIIYNIINEILNMEKLKKYIKSKRDQEINRNQVWQYFILPQFYIAKNTNV